MEKNKIYVIAEIGINANGDMTIAKQLIDKAKRTGADAVKFQKRTIDLVYSQEELEKPRESPWGNTTREQKEGLEFSIEQYKELFTYSKILGLDFIVSCWDINSLYEIEKNINVDYHKVASAMLTDKEFLEKLNETGKPIILSTGMSSVEEVKRAMEILKNVKYILACTSTYPTDVKEVNLRSIEYLKILFPENEIGFSNHYSGIVACGGAAALGAKCIEFHITLDRTMYGSDQAASIENSDDLISAIRTIEKMLGEPRKIVFDSEIPILKKLRKKNTI